MLEQAEINNIEAMLFRYHLRLSCMENHPLATERGAPMKCYKDCIKKSLTTCQVDALCWLDIVADRDAWRHSILKEVNKFEKDRGNAQKDKRSKMKARAASNNTPNVTFTCGYCSQHYFLLLLLP